MGVSEEPQPPKFLPGTPVVVAGESRVVPGIAPFITLDSAIPKEDGSGWLIGVWDDEHQEVISVPEEDLVPVEPSVESRRARAGAPLAAVDGEPWVSELIFRLFIFRLLGDSGDEAEIEKMKDRWLRELAIATEDPGAVGSYRIKPEGGWVIELTAHPPGDLHDAAVAVQARFGGEWELISDDGWARDWDGSFHADGKLIEALLTTQPWNSPRIR